MNSIVEEARAHRACNHPYLVALRDGQFQNVDKVLLDFAAQYGFYSAWFPRYLTAVISRMDNSVHRQHLINNLAEESGQLHDEDLAAIRGIGIQESWVQGISHPELFRRFQTHVGVRADNSPGIEVQVWRESFLSLVQFGSPAEAIGAIGLGTESIVKHIYGYLIESIQKFTDLSLDQYVFFPLHTEVDDEHGLILLDIAQQLSAQSEQSAIDLRKGMLKALNLRSAFWDGMLLRAQHIDAAEGRYAA